MPNKITQPVRPEARLAVLWVGHATVLIQIDDKFILTDPVFTNTVGQLSKRLVEPGIEPQNLPPIDAVIISHMHFDHFSFGSLDLVEKKVARILVPRGGLVYMPNYSFPATELSRWEHWESNGLQITAVPVKHNGMRYGLDGEWMETTFTGYVISYHGITVYFGGDTAYVQKNFVETAEHFPSIDLALMPIAPIEPRGFMKASHVDPKEAVQAFFDLKARRMVPIHFDTFINSTDQVGDATRVLGEVMRERNIGPDKISVLRIGEQRTIIAR
ncbi:MAG: MBL fold metallo-hydrolase [Polyangiaceae bacterium]